jgi:SAM-dependent methyltransferase
MDAQLTERDRAEIERSAEEARKRVVEPVDWAQVERYLDPPSDTAYPLEYAFHLLGDVRGKTVLDFGCGAGENVVPLVKRGAHVIGLDISPELVNLARQRLHGVNLEADLRVGSAYATGLPDASVDVIFSIMLIHHLDIVPVCREMLRILVPGGRVILKEPIRFSASYARLRNLLPARSGISEYEHPLTRAELTGACAPFKPEGVRYFRLPFVPLAQRVGARRWPWKIDRRLIRLFPALSHFATSVVVCLQK